jgi:hypothetical protein
MMKAKAKAKPALHHDGPTPERMAKGDWAIIAAPKLADDDWRDRTAKARVAVNPLLRLHRLGWFDDEGLRVLLAYQALIETAGYNKSRSCIDFSQAGGCNDRNAIPRYVIARDKLAGIDIALRGAVNHRGIDLLHATLGPFGSETIGDAVERQREALPRSAGMAWARDVFSAAAVALVTMGL